MADPVYGLSAEDVAILREMAREWKYGDNRPRPRHQRKALPFRYPGAGGTPFVKTSTHIAGRVDATGATWTVPDVSIATFEQDPDGTLKQSSTAASVTNYSYIPSANGRFHMTMLDEQGKKILLPLWSNFCIQCVCRSASGGITPGVGSRLPLTTWDGPNGAGGFDGDMWYEWDGTNNRMNLLLDGDYFIFATVRFSCASGGTGMQTASLSVEDAGTAVITSGSATFQRDNSVGTSATLTAFGMHERTSSGSTQSIGLAATASPDATISSAKLFIIPVGFGEQAG